MIGLSKNISHGCMMHFFEITDMMLGHTDMMYFFEITILSLLVLLI